MRGTRGVKRKNRMKFCLHGPMDDAKNAETPISRRGS